MPTLNGAVVLVTGANGGIGTHFVHEALARGASKVYATARNPRTWDDERIVPITLDITDSASIQEVVEAAEDVTVLINNAGAIPPSASLLTVTDADIRANMETNFFGPVFIAAPSHRSSPPSTSPSWLTSTRLPAGMPVAAPTVRPRLHCGRPRTLCVLSLRLRASM